MRLIDAHITNYRSVGDVLVPLDGLTVLTDPDRPQLVDDVLTAVDWMLRGGLTAPRLSLPGSATADEFPDGSVTAFLDQRTVPGSADHALVVRLLTEYLYGASLDYDEPLNLNELNRLDQLAHAAIHHKVDGPFAGSREDRDCLARATTVSGVVAREYGQTGFRVHDTDLDASEIEAAARLSIWRPEGEEAESSLFGGDELLNLAEDVCAGKPGVTSLAGTGFGYEDKLCEVVDLGAPAANFASQLRSAITDLSAFIEYPPEPGVLVLRGFTLPNGEDPWLDACFTQKDPSAGWWSQEAAPVDAPVTVRPVILEAAALLGRHATRLAPSFLTDVGHIDVAVCSPMRWHTQPDRLQVEFHGIDGTSRALADLDPGTARWIVVALRLAMMDLAALDLAVPDAERVLSEARDAARDELASLIDDIEVCPVLASGLGPFCIIEEPERHLGRDAVESVGRWLEALARTRLGVLVTTNSEIITSLDANTPSLSTPVSS